MTIDIKKLAEQKMHKSLEALKTDFVKIRTGRAHTGLLDHITVNCYDTLIPISQVANITLLDARTIGAAPWEKKMLGVIERTIRDSGLGLNPVTTGELIRIPMPALTEERRRDLIKIVKNEAETARVAMRNIRRDANANLKSSLRDKEISEDDERYNQDEIQKITNSYISEVDRILQIKETELLLI